MDRSCEMEGGRMMVVVVADVAMVFVDDVDDGRRDRVIDFGVMTCRTGESDGVGCVAAGESFFMGENKSISSKLTRSMLFIDVCNGSGDGGTGGTTFVGDFVSVIVRLRLLAGVCGDEMDGERDR